MSILGYASATSVTSDETISFHLGSDSGHSTRALLRLERIGNALTNETFQTTVLPHQPPTSNGWEGYSWPATINFTIPRHWPSGFYRLFVNEAGQNNNILTFVIRARSPGTHSKVLFQISYLTPAAYNSVGGKSFYSPPNNANRARKVSLNRPSPYPRIAHDGSPDRFIREAKLVEWLQGESIDIECCSSIDLHADPNLLDDYDCLVIAYHDEYWTKAMRDHCENFVRNGGNLIILSGNTCFRQVRLEEDDNGTVNRTVVFYKFANLDPIQNNDETSIAWAQPPVNRPQNSLLGVGFTHGAFSLRWAERRAYTIRHPRHWVFAGVSSNSTTPFMYYETDAAAFVEEPEGYPRVTGAEQTPLNTTILATADLQHWSGKPGWATMTLYSRNGTVFNAATTDWLDALSTDAAVTQITRNVFNKLKRPIPWNWEYIGHANSATAMTALEGKIFLTTNRHELWRRFPVGTEVPWTKIDRAYNVISMASMDAHIVCLTSSNTLWQRPAAETDVDWHAIGEGPTRLRTIASASGLLYATDYSGQLWRASVQNNSIRYWTRMEGFRDRTVKAMTSYNDILFASTEDNRLLRTNRDFIAESDAWHRIHHCNSSIGLAVVDWMLYVCTSGNGLWQIDLSGLREP